MQKTNVGIDMLFEVSWEVCNKVGGIYNRPFYESKGTP